MQLALDSLLHPLLKRAYSLGCKVAPALPARPPGKLLARLLNQQLKQEIDDGDFDFLSGKVLEVLVTDFHLSFKITLSKSTLVSAPADVKADATIAAASYDLLAIINGREDPDTLFFQRKLRISGDTDLGLTAKNRLDAIDRSRLPSWLHKGLNHADRLLTTMVAR